MSEFSVRVVRIWDGDISHHPNADRLSLIQIGGYTCISAKLEDGSHRYKPGDLVVYVPEGAVVPEYLLKQGFWNEKENKGFLSGPKGDCVKAMTLRGIVSQGILFPVDWIEYDEIGLPHGMVLNDTGYMLRVREGDDVAEHLGITKFVPTIPEHMEGQIVHVPGSSVKFDFESIQMLTDLFDHKELVEVTEKLHGTFLQFGYVPGLNHPDLFFDGNVYCTSKGYGAQELVFKNTPDNDGNVYVKMLRKLLADGLGEKLKALSEREHGQAVRIFGEIIGKGIQDLHYGCDKHTLYIFDVMDGAEFLTSLLVDSAANTLGVGRAPILYFGPYDLEVLRPIRDGKDTISNGHIREGIVIRAVTHAKHPVHGRKIGKWVSPDYLLRKNATEYN